MLVIRAISVRYLLRADPARHELVERVHDMHARFCPVARTLAGSVEIDTSFELIA